MSKKKFNKSTRRTHATVSRALAKLRANEVPSVHRRGDKDRFPWTLNQSRDSRVKFNRYFWLETPVRLGASVVARGESGCAASEAWATILMDLGQRTIEDVLVTAGRPNAQSIKTFLTGIGNADSADCTCRSRSHRLRVFTDHAANFLTPALADTLVGLDIVILRVPPSYLTPKSRVERWFANLNRWLLENLPAQQSDLKERNTAAGNLDDLLTTTQLRKVIHLWIAENHFSSSYLHFRKNDEKGESE